MTNVYTRSDVSDDLTTVRYGRTNYGKDGEKHVTQSCVKWETWK